MLRIQSATSGSRLELHWRWVGTNLEFWGSFHGTLCFTVRQAGSRGMWKSGLDLPTGEGAQRGAHDTSHRHPGLLLWWPVWMLGKSPARPARISRVTAKPCFLPRPSYTLGSPLLQWPGFPLTFLNQTPGPLNFLPGNKVTHTYSSY